jgi:hypothetical protein
MSELEMTEDRTPDDRPRVQLQLVLPYKAVPAEHPQVKAYLERGYHIEQLQRLTDREALVTVSLPEPTAS